MIPLLSMLVAIACAVASARRLWFVTTATAFDPDAVLEALHVRRTSKGRAVPADDRVRAGIEALRQAVIGAPDADWERDLFAALDADDANTRAALVNEQLTELDYRIQRWARVPRVCASIATSFGFLLATLVLRRGLYAADLTGDVGELFVRGLVGDAFTVALFGVVGTAFCIAAQSAAKRLAKRRIEAADALVGHLESHLHSAASTPPAEPAHEPDAAARNPVLSG